MLSLKVGPSHHLLVFLPRSIEAICGSVPIEGIRRSSLLHSPNNTSSQRCSGFRVSRIENVLPPPLRKKKKTRRGIVPGQQREERRRGRGMLIVRWYGDSTRAGEGVMGGMNRTDFGATFWGGQCAIPTKNSEDCCVSSYPGC